MSRRFGNPIVILQAIVNRLIERIGSAEPATCYLAINPDSVADKPSAGRMTFVVSPASGSFSEPLFDGGGAQQLSLAGGVIIKLHGVLQLDEVGRDTQTIVHESEGLLRNATEVLDALTNWSPQDVAGNEQTRDPLYPREISFTKDARGRSGCEISFACNFDWGLSN